MESFRSNTTGRSYLYQPEGGYNNPNSDVFSWSASYYGRGVSPASETHYLPTAHGVDSTRLPTGNNQCWCNPNKSVDLLNKLEPPKIWNQLYQDYVINDDHLEEFRALKTRKRQAERMFQLLQNWFQDSAEEERYVVFKGLCKALTDACREHLIGYLNLRYVPQVYLERIGLSGARAFGHYSVQTVTEQMTGLQIAGPLTTSSRQPVEHTENREDVLQPPQPPQPSVEVLLPYSTEESMQNPQDWRW